MSQGESDGTVTATDIDAAVVRRHLQVANEQARAFIHPTRIKQTPRRAEHEGSTTQVRLENNVLFEPVHAAKLIVENGH